MESAPASEINQDEGQDNYMDNNIMPQATTSAVPQLENESLYPDNTGYWNYPSTSTSHGVKNIYEYTFNIMPQASTSAVPQHENESLYPGTIRSYEDNTGYLNFPSASTSHGVENIYQGTFNSMHQVSTYAVPEHENESFHQAYTSNGVENIYESGSNLSELNHFPDTYMSYNFMPQTSTSAVLQREVVDIDSEDTEIDLNLSL